MFIPYILRTFAKEEESKVYRFYRNYENNEILPV